MSPHAIKSPVDQPSWKDSDDISVLSDSERHLAHVIQVDGRWLAFDATHLNTSGNGFTFLGARTLLEDAKDLAERTLRGESVRAWIEGGRMMETSLEAHIEAHIKGQSEAPPPSEVPQRSVYAELETSALNVEWSTLRRDWRQAQRLVRKLVTTVEVLGLSSQEPAKWMALAEAARDLGRAVLRRQMQEILTALATYRRELGKLK